MALSSKSRRRGLMAEINVVPYIDVMLVLVVILMVAAPFVNPSVVNLPSVNKASKAPEKVVEVVVIPTAVCRFAQARKCSRLTCLDWLPPFVLRRPGMQKFQW